MPYVRQPNGSYVWMESNDPRLRGIDPSLILGSNNPPGMPTNPPPYNPATGTPANVAYPSPVLAPPQSSPPALDPRAAGRTQALADHEQYLRNQRPPTEEEWLQANARPQESFLDYQHQPVQPGTYPGYGPDIMPAMMGLFRPQTDDQGQPVDFQTSLNNIMGQLPAAYQTGGFGNALTALGAKIPGQEEGDAQPTSFLGNVINNLFRGGGSSNTAGTTTGTGGGEDPAGGGAAAQSYRGLTGAGALEDSAGMGKWRDLFETAAKGGKFQPKKGNTIGPVVVGDPLNGQPGGTEELAMVTGADHDTALHVEPTNPLGAAAAQGGGNIAQEIAMHLQAAIEGILQKMLGQQGGGPPPAPPPMEPPPGMDMMGGMPRMSTGGTASTTGDVTDKLYYRTYDPKTLGDQPFIKKLRGESDSVPWKAFAGSLDNPALGIDDMPSLINMQTFRDLYPSERDQSRSLYEQGLYVDWRDIMERSQRAVPGGFAPSWGGPGYG